jgi:hypothetical protein
VRERPWGRIYRYGELWLKINGGGTTYEPALLDLMRGRPLVPFVVATEPSRGWTLLADAGRSMREIGGGDDEVVERWLDVLPRYARLQQSFAGSADAARVADVPDHSSQSLVAALRRLAPLSARAEDLLALDLMPWWRPWTPVAFPPRSSTAICTVPTCTAWLEELLAPAP